MDFQPFDMKANNWDAKEMAKTLGITQAIANVLKQNGRYNSIRSIEIKLSAKMDFSNSRNQENFAILNKANDNNLITF